MATTMPPADHEKARERAKESSSRQPFVIPPPADPPRAEEQRADQQRMVQWVQDHGRAVRGYVLAMTRRHDLADDVTQETFRRAWSARDRYRDLGTARAFLLRIADRLVCDAARKRSREVHLDAAAWEIVDANASAGNPEDPAMAAAAREARQQLQTALDVLKPEQRRVLLLRYYGGLEFSEIADEMQCPLNTALSHCRRGLQALRKLLLRSGGR